MSMACVTAAETQRLGATPSSVADIEYQARLDSARAESDRRKGDFLKKVRALNQKKMEPAEAEAEYELSR